MDHVLEKDAPLDREETWSHPANGTLDDLLAEVALTFPLMGYAVHEDAEAAFDTQILGALVAP